jgi:cytochrome c
MRHAGVLIALTLIAGAALIGAALASPHATSGHRILVFSKTDGFRHASIPVAVRAVRELGARSGVAVDATEDADAFTPSNLARYDAVVFLLTTGDVLNDGQQAAFERYIRSGGGFAGVHSAADTEYGWGWYGSLLGARFRSHPQIQRASIRVENRAHPSTAGLPANWVRADEWYNFTRRSRRGVKVLARLDETSYAPGQGAMGADHPIAWSQAFEGGRAWFTGGGHTDESFSEPLFRRHLLGGIRYAAGLTPPRIVSVRHSVGGRRLAAEVRYASCSPCRGRLEIVVRGRARNTRLAIGGAVARARSGPLPAGRWQFRVVLRDPVSAVSRSVSRSVRIR